MLAISIAVCGYPIGVGLAQLILPPVSHAFGWPAGFVSGCVVPAIALVLFVASFRGRPTSRRRRAAFALPSLRECLLIAIAGVIWTAYTAGFAGYLSYVPSTLARRGRRFGADRAWSSRSPPGATFRRPCSAAVWPGASAGSRVLVIGTLGLAIGTAGTALFTCRSCGRCWWVRRLDPSRRDRGARHAVRAARSIARSGMGIFYSLYYAGGTIGPALCGRAADLYGGPAGGLLAAAVIALPWRSRCTCCTSAWRGVRCCRPWWPGSRAEKRSAAFSPGGGRCAFPP